MPYYEYRCNECGHEFEKMLRFSESDLLPTCPHCSGSQTRKKLSAVAAVGAGESTPGGYTSSSCGSRGGFS
jgi:putative FmdB family regulatory protein